MLPLPPAPTPGLPPPPHPRASPLPSLYTSLSHELPAIKSGGKDPCPGHGVNPHPAGPPWLLPLPARSSSGPDIAALCPEHASIGPLCLHCPRRLLRTPFPPAARAPSHPPGPRASGLSLSALRDAAQNRLHSWTSGLSPAAASPAQVCPSLSPLLTHRWVQGSGVLLRDAPDCLPG